MKDEHIYQILIKMQEKDAKLVKYQTAINRVSTRETSTVTVASITSSASLILLTLNPLEFRWFGLIFALLGIGYRELTIFSADKQDYDFIHQFEIINKIRSRMSKKERKLRFFRALIVRLLLFLPVVLFFLPFFKLLLKPCQTAVLLFAGVIVDFVDLACLCIIIPLIYEEKMISDC